MASLVRRIKSELFSEIKKLKIGGLISISLVGSFQRAEKLDAVNDVDLIIIVRKLTPKVFNQINSGFRRISKKLKFAGIRFTIENKIGPYKPNPVKRLKIVQLQILLYDIRKWRKIIKTPFAWECINFNQKLRGKSLRAIANPSKLKAAAVMKNLQKLLMNLKKLKAKTRMYKIKGNEVVAISTFMKLSKHNFAEWLNYNIITSFLDYSRIPNPNLEKNKNVLIRIAEKILPEDHYKTLKKSFVVKQKAKVGSKIKRRELENLRKEGIKFIEFLISELKNK